MNLGQKMFPLTRRLRAQKVHHGERVYSAAFALQGRHQRHFYQQ